MGISIPDTTGGGERRIIVAISHGSSLKSVSLGTGSSLDKQKGMELWKLLESNIINKLLVSLPQTSKKGLTFLVPLKASSL